MSHPLAAYGWQLVLANHVVAGLAALAQAVDDDPSATHLGAYGIALGKAKRIREAVDALRRSLAQDDSRIALWCCLGELALDIPDYATALEALSRCVKLDPQATHPSGVRARALIKRGEKILTEATKRS